MPMEDVVVKLEPGWRNLESAVSEAAALDWLYEGHQVKEELVLGPEVLQAPDVAYAHAEQDSCLNTGQPPGAETQHNKGPDLRDCVVMLTRISQDKLKQNGYNSKSNIHSFNNSKDEAKPKLKKVGIPQIHKKKEDCICSVCQKEFSSRSSLNRHMKIHTGDIPSQKLEKGFAKKNLGQTLLHEDIKNTKVSESFGLKNCFVLLERISKVNINIHEQNAKFSKHYLSHVDDSSDSASVTPDTVENKVTHTCEICSKIFKDRSSVNFHIRTVHAMEKLYQCDVCEKRFTVEKYLRRHKALHGKRRFKCMECDKRFATKQSLKQHKRVHASKPYSCNVCDKKFIWKHNRDLHKLIHTGDKLHSCPECKIQFRKKKSLLTHMKKHSNGLDLIQAYPASPRLTYCCEICKKLLASRSNYENHKLIHTGDRPWSCNLCEKKFRLKSTLDRHLLIHSGELNRPHSCEICGYKFVDKSNLTSHMRSHTGEKPFACGLCEKRYRLKGDLKNHIRSHTGQRPYACKICDQRFMTNSNLRQHLRTHTIKKKYLCEICSDGFKTKLLLAKHITTHLTQVLDQYYVCDVCNKVHKEKNCLIKHLRFHTGEDPYLCGTCPQRFTNSSDLSNHRQTHLQGSDCVCQPCVKGFNSDRNFIRHVMRIHTREKLYSCEICALQFVYPGDLNEHKRSHKKEEYVCDMCQKKYGRKSTLIGHIRTHTGEKPYKCDVCAKRFTVRCLLKQHQKVHSNKKAYVCVKCKKSFTQKMHLLRHVSCRDVNTPYACKLCDKRYAEMSFLTKHIANKHE